jgi:acyl-CoA thioester hydrolase
MTQPARRKRGGYFTAPEGAPPPIAVRLTQRIRFSDVDPMGILWHGRYAKLFEQANDELGGLCRMTYPDFRRERIMAPIVQLHVDYFAPVMLGEQVTIVGRMIYTESARANIEYEIVKQDGTLAAAGYTVQMFVDESGAPLMASPALLEACRARWKSGQIGAAR